MEDIIAVVALHRPGPLGSGMVDDFVERRHGHQAIPEMDPAMADILRDTCGIITYQEQIMRVANRVAGMPLCEALTMIKAIGKKNRPKIEEYRKQFVAGAVKHGMTPERAEEIFNLIREFAGYGFNRAHATAYAFLAYRTAFLKANYPVEFAAAGMTCDMGVVDKVVNHIQDCRRLGISVLPPSVNESMPYFTVSGGGAIRYGLAALRGIGARATEAIVREREKNGPFRGLEELCSRVDHSALNRAGVETLIRAGALDCLPGARAQMAAHLEAAMRIGQQMQKDRRQGQMNLFDMFGASDGEAAADALPDVEEWPSRDMLAYEKDALGFYMSGHPLVEHQRLLEPLSSCAVGELGEQPGESGQTLGGMVVSVRRITARNGKPMAHIEFEDLTGKVRCVVFNEPYSRYGDLLKEEAILFIQGKVDRSMERVSFQVENVIRLEEARSRLAGSATIMLERAGLEEESLQALRKLCDRHSGAAPLALHIHMPDGRAVRIRAGRDMAVAVSEAFEADLEALVGQGRLRLTPTPYEPRGNGGKWRGGQWNDE